MPEPRPPHPPAYGRRPLPLQGRGALEPHAAAPGQLSFWGHGGGQVEGLELELGGADADGVAVAQLDGLAGAELAGVDEGAVRRGAGALAVLDGEGGVGADVRGAADG